MERVKSSAVKDGERLKEMNGDNWTYETLAKKIREDRRERELILEEKIYTLRSYKLTYLKAENELLKKIRYDGKGDEEIEVIPPSQKYILIRSVIEKYKLKNMVSYLCKIAGVSRSGYYNYFSSEIKEQRKKDEKDKFQRRYLKSFQF